MSESNLPVAVVTGASSGIGAATAQLLARRGYRVVLMARGAEALEKLRAEIEGAGGVARAEPCDASDGGAVLEMAARVRESWGAPEVVVNSAGAGQWKFIEETPPSEARSMMGAPYFAAYNTSHAFMQDMLGHKRGVIIHVGSPASRLAWPGATGYTAARWALRGLHEALAQDLRGTGVHSCHVVFGKVTSAYFENNPDSEAYIPAIGNMIPVISPETCAEIILKTVARPRHTVVYPFMLKAFYWTAALMPGLVASLVAGTGRKH